MLQEIGPSVSPEILGNTVAGVAKLDEFTMSLNWSRVGDLHMLLIQVPVSIFPTTWISFCYTFVQDLAALHCIANSFIMYQDFTFNVNGIK